MTHTSHRDPEVVEPPHPTLVGAAALVLGTIAGCLSFIYHYFDDVARDQSGTLLARAIEEGTASYTVALLFVALVYFTWRFPIIGRGTWKRSLPAHLAGVVVFSALHTTMMWGTRVVLFPAFGLAPYDYGWMPARYLMEFGADSVSYVMLVGLILGYRQYRQLRQRELREARLEQSLAQAELRSLRLQLQPHFLFNALNTISSTMYDDPRSADRMIGQLAELLRLSLRTAHAHEVPLREELDVLGQYVGIMRARFGERLRLDLDVAEEALDALVPSFLLQPLVENAVRHGAGARGSGGAVTVAVRRDGDRLLVEVEDDGPGAPVGRDVMGAGLGLRATTERLRLLYGAAHTFEAGNRDGGGGGFRVAIGIPFRSGRTTAAGSPSTPPMEGEGAPRLAASAPGVPGA